MTYFSDGSTLHYHQGPYDADSWKCRLIAIGWLEHPYPYEMGACTEDILVKIVELRQQFQIAFPGQIFRGLHVCSFCTDTAAAVLPESHINLFIPADDVLFVAPGRIDHYIENHSYTPADVFLEALMYCPDPRTQVYSKQLTILNHGERPPLLGGEWAVFRMDGEGNRFLMFRYDTKTAAQQIADLYTSRDPKRTYQVEYTP